VTPAPDVADLRDRVHAVVLACQTDLFAADARRQEDR
jgi:hypothetical protein